MTNEETNRLCEMFKDTYTGAVSDCLDRNGYRNQTLPYYINPLNRSHKIIGPAFTGFGESHDNPKENDTGMRVKMLEKIPMGCISVWQTSNNLSCAHWGEIMSKAARNKGCIGAVVDGGARDLEMILEMDFPLFYRFSSPASSVGRWSIRDFDVAITIGRTSINPGDLVIADIDGVVIIPISIAHDVAEDVKKLTSSETMMRKDLKDGTAITEVYKKYGEF
jgi:4-hydroxy-4-methyl-2-oxoglutarate aldolase